MSHISSLSSPMIPYQEIDHTADAGIRAFGRNLPELFIHAAQGMFSLILDPAFYVPGSDRLIVNIAADSQEALLKEWLSELLFRHTTANRIYAEYEIIEFSETRLYANAWGFPIDEETRVKATEIKAVTWHGLRIMSTDEGFAAEVIFDT